MSEDDQATVLIVDDEPAIVDGHAAHLRTRYDVRTAYDGEEAIEKLDDAVDVVFLDRRMPGLSGDQVLEQIRSDGIACRVAMLTGVEPSFDIVDMGFDDYLRKPVSKDTLFDTVERLLQRARYDSKLQRYFSLASKVAVLETEHDSLALERRPEYIEMCKELTKLQQQLDSALEQLPDEDGYAVATQGPAAQGDRTDV